ncbi:CAZyme family PL14 [Agaricus bisporus var. burnettii]|uniref:CAZyme family PL14 n=1 Tax=Agaricus bisporus var. burnettii TaxID=192524 RepID=A0A8H7F892_AGABI|nr:CAZyme family PL14 [Agaricus bisporus var. burnettii]
MASALASQYGLATSTVFPFPTSTLSSNDAASHVVSQWSLGGGRIQEGANDIAFVQDPFPNSVPIGSSGGTPGNGNSSVLEIIYPKGSFSHDTGGAQWYNLWNTSDGSSFNSMLLSYELAFDSSFEWVKGGKLPGLRGGLEGTGCSGGNSTPNGKECFSSRLMWRKDAEGEVYAYIPSPNDLCKDKDVICNSDFGISLQRGVFGFISGQWLRVTMLVRMNDPPNIANGEIQVYYNDRIAVSKQGLQIRSVDTLHVNGLFFSTFFGGSDKSWATPDTTHTYYRNIALWGSSAPSNLTGDPVRSAASLTSSIPTATLILFCLSITLLF